MKSLYSSCVQPHLSEGGDLNLDPVNRLSVLRIRKDQEDMPPTEVWMAEGKREGAIVNTNVGAHVQLWADLPQTGK